MAQNTPRRRESGDQRDDPQKLESSQIGANEHTKPDSVDNPYAGKDLSNPSAQNDQEFASDHGTRQDSSKKTVRLSELRSDRHQNTSQPIHPNYKIDRVKAVVPEPQFKNPITQKESLYV